MYLIKYIILLMSSLYGQQCLLAQNYSKRVSIDEAGYHEKYLPSDKGDRLRLRFESLERLISRFPRFAQLVKGLEGNFECRLQLALRKEKVLGVRLFLAEAKHLGKRIRWQHRRILKRGFRQLDFVVLSESVQKSFPKRCKTSWLFQIKNGEISLL